MPVFYIYYYIYFSQHNKRELNPYFVDQETEICGLLSCPRSVS